MDAALSLISRERPGGLYVSVGGPIYIHRARIIEFAARQRLPAIYPQRLPVTEGGLMSYSSDIDAIVRRVAAIVDSVLKGAKPADIPVEEPSKYEFVINLKTARAMNLKIPQSVLLQATEVIE